MRRLLVLPSVIVMVGNLAAAASVRGQSLRQASGEAGVVPAPTCSATQPVKEQPPKDPSADPFFGRWYVNDDRTMWAGWDAVQMRSGRKGNKVLWVRPRGTQLKITGRRLDAQSAPLKAVIPCCYPSGFQATGLYLPSEGCWEVTGKAGASALTFITWVRVGPEAEQR